MFQRWKDTVIKDAKQCLKQFDIRILVSIYNKLSSNYKVMKNTKDFFALWFVVSNFTTCCKFKSHTLLKTTSEQFSKLILWWLLAYCSINIVDHYSCELTSFFNLFAPTKRIQTLLNTPMYIWVMKERYIFNWNIDKSI